MRALNWAARTVGEAAAEFAAALHPPARPAGPDRSELSCVCAVTERAGDPDRPATATGFALAPGRRGPTA